MHQSEEKEGQKRYPCPCCKYLTHDGSDYEICPICFWHDDGQDDSDADEVQGGPNYNLSLTQARYNYARLGAVDWHIITGVRSELTTTTPRAKEVNFAEITRLSELPPLNEWNIQSRVLSMHLRDEDLLTRWTRAVMFVLDHGFKFQGTYGHTDHLNPNWTALSAFIKYDHDKSILIQKPVQKDETVIVDAWFVSADNKSGIRISYQAGWKKQQGFNEPSIDLEVHLESEFHVTAMFDDLIQQLRPLIAVISYTRQGIGPLSYIFRNTFHYGDVFYSRDLVRPEDLESIYTSYGKENVVEMDDGYKCFHNLIVNRQRNEMPGFAHSMQYEFVKSINKFLGIMLTAYLKFPIMLERR